MLKLLQSPSHVAFGAFRLEHLNAYIGAHCYLWIKYELLSSHHLLISGVLLYNSLVAAAALSLSGLAAFHSLASKRAHIGVAS